MDRGRCLLPSRVRAITQLAGEQIFCSTLIQPAISVSLIQFLFRLKVVTFSHNNYLHYFIRVIKPYHGKKMRIHATFTAQCYLDSLVRRLAPVLFLCIATVLELQVVCATRCTYDFSGFLLPTIGRSDEWLESTGLFALARKAADNIDVELVNHNGSEGAADIMLYSVFEKESPAPDQPSVKVRKCNWLQFKTITMRSG